MQEDEPRPRWHDTSALDVASRCLSVALPHIDEDARSRWLRLVAGWPALTRRHLNFNSWNSARDLAREISQSAPSDAREREYRRQLRRFWHYNTPGTEEELLESLPRAGDYNGSEIPLVDEELARILSHRQLTLPECAKIRQVLPRNFSGSYKVLEHAEIAPSGRRYVL